MLQIRIKYAIDHESRLNVESACNKADGGYLEPALYSTQIDLTRSVSIALKIVIDRATQQSKKIYTQNAYHHKLSETSARNIVVCHRLKLDIRLSPA